MGQHRWTRRVLSGETGPRISNCRRRPQRHTVLKQHGNPEVESFVHDKQMNQLRCPSACVSLANRSTTAAQWLSTCSSPPCAQTLSPGARSTKKPHAFTLIARGCAWEAAAGRSCCAFMRARVHRLTPSTSFPRPWEGALEGAAALEVRGAHGLAHVLLQLGLHLAPLDGLGRSRARALLIRLHCAGFRFRVSSHPRHSPDLNGLGRCRARALLIRLHCAGAGPHTHATGHARTHAGALHDLHCACRLVHCVHGPLEKIGDRADTSAT